MIADKDGRIQIGQQAVATKNFVLDSTAADGSMKLARGNAGATTQDVLTVDSLGLAKSFGSSGYCTLPGGLIAQWGTTTISTGAANTWAGSVGNVTFPTAFTTAVYATVATSTNMSSVSSQSISLSMAQNNLSSASLYALTQVSAAPNVQINWIVIGK